MEQQTHSHIHTSPSNTVTYSPLIRRLCWLSLSSAAAIALSVYLLDGMLPFLLGFCCFSVVFLSRLLPGSLRQKTAWAAAGLALGFLWTGCYQHLARTPARTLISEEYAAYTLEITEYPRESQSGTTLSARILLDGTPGPRLQLYTDHDATTLFPGDTVSAVLKLVAADLSRGEKTSYHESKGIFLIGYGQGEIALLNRPSVIPLRYWPVYAAHILKGSVTALFPADVSGFLTALLTGDKQSLPYGLYPAFQRAGLAHIIAVSGLHIGFLLGLFSTLFRKRDPFGVGIEISLIFLFAAMTGNAPSALRAAFMASLLLIAPLLHRENDPAITLSAALLFLLLPCPYEIANTGLQLSFAAMAGINWVGIPLFNGWCDRIPAVDKPLGRLFSSFMRFCLASFCTTVGSLFFTAPLTALYFRSVSLVWPFSNLLVLPLVSIVFSGGLAAAVIGIFSPFLGGLAAALIAWPARWIMTISKWLAALPFSSLSLLSGYLALWFATAYFILFLWYLGRKRIRPLIPAVALILTLPVALYVQNRQLYRYPLTVTALDVGQGASTLFFSRGETLLVDCGGNNFSNAGDLAADQLQAMGCSRLDTLVLTHCHSDHANGVLELMARLPVSHLILPDTDRDSSLRQEILDVAAAANCQIEFLTQDTQLTLGDARFSLFAPLGDGGSNEEGLSLLCSLDGYDILLTGDMNDTVEKRLVKYKNLPDIELLMVGHHGSSTATSEALLLATQPDAAVISSGYNSYGHPSPEVLERLGALGCDIYRTDGMGTITFYINGGINR